VLPPSLGVDESKVKARLVYAGRLQVVSCIHEREAAFSFETSLSTFKRVHGTTSQNTAINTLSLA
jgi:hypothetical protein